MPGYHQDRFAQHLAFAVTEAIPFIEQEFEFTTERRCTIAAGQSNSGVFALAAALNAPERFGGALVMSRGYETYLADIPTSGSDQRMAFTGGVYEPYFLRSTRRTYDRLKDHLGAAQFQTYVNGHDDTQWRLALYEHAPFVFEGC